MIKALKWRPHAQAKWITSPQIERSFCVWKLGPHAGFRARGCIKGWGAGEWLGSLICRLSRDTEGAGSDRLQEDRARWEQPDTIAQTEEKLIESVLIEKSTDPHPPAVWVPLWWCMLKDWGRMGWDGMNLGVKGNVR